MDRFLYRIHCTTAIAAIKASSPNSRLLLSRCLFCLAVLFTFGLVFFHLRYATTGQLRGLFGDLPCVTSEIRSGISYHPGQCNHNDYGLSKDAMTKGIYNINVLVNLSGVSSVEHKQQPYVYRYSPVKGLLDLDKEFLVTYKIPVKTTNITCYQNSYNYWLADANSPLSILAAKGFFSMEAWVYWLIGFDKIVLNSIILNYNGTGYIETPNSRVFDLNYASEFQSSVNGPFANFVFKSGVVITTVFLFFVTSNLVNFTICETQQRMVKFTRAVRSNIRNRRSYSQVVLSQILHSLVFVAMIFGVLFFLFEVYGEDHVLSFIVLCLMWFNEIYSVTTLRSIESTRFFPTVFFFLFSLFHIYFFSFPFGFHLLALWCWMAWNAFACFYFWNFFELPQIAAELL